MESHAVNGTCILLTPTGTGKAINAAGGGVTITGGFSIDTLTVTTNAMAWNSAWDTEVQSEATDALNAYDPPTNAEMEARTIAAASYALASVCTEARLAELDAANLPADIDAVPTVSEIWTTALTEAYRSAGAAGTAAQLLHEILQNITEFAISGTTKTVKKFDASTTAKTYTLDSAVTPTSITETT